MECSAWKTAAPTVLKKPNTIQDKMAFSKWHTILTWKYPSLSSQDWVPGTQSCSTELPSTFVLPLGSFNPSTFYVDYQSNPIPPIISQLLILSHMPIICSLILLPSSYFMSIYSRQLTYHLWAMGGSQSIWEKLVGKICKLYIEEATRQLLGLNRSNVQTKYQNSILPPHSCVLWFQ